MPSLPNIGNYASGQTINLSMKNVDCVNLDADVVSCTDLVVDGTTFDLADITSDISALQTKTQYLTSSGGNSTALSGSLNVDSGTFVVDGSNNRIGVCNANPAVALDVTGSSKISGDLTVDTDSLIVDSTTHRVGINVASPSVALDVDGDVEITGDVTVATNVLFVDSSSQSVGINTITPGADLDVNGDAQIVGDFLAGDSTLFLDKLTHRCGINNVNPSVDLDVTGDVKVSSDMAVDTNTLVVDASNHRVGILNASPTVALDVTGAAKVSGDMTVDTNTLVVDSTNNRVGILNASPTVALDVTGASKVSGNLAVDTNTLYVDSTNHCVGLGKTNPLYLLDSATCVNVGSGYCYRINGVDTLNATTLGGNVVSSSLQTVGTLSTLTVSGDTSLNTSSSTFKLYGQPTLYPDNAGTSTNCYLTIRNRGDGNGSPNYIKVGTEYTSGYNGVAVVDTGKAGVASDTPLSLRTKGTEAIRITTAQKVGIGTSSPSATLHVEGSLRVNEPTAGATIAQFLNTSMANGDSTQVRIGKDATEWDCFELKYAHVDGTQKNTFSIGPYAHSPWMYFYNGNIGLGTSTPSYSLHLNNDSAAKPSTNTWTVSSDERLKVNISMANLDTCYNNIKSIPLKRFTWRDDMFTNEEVPDRSKIGWIAQDVELVFPKAVEQKSMYGYDDCRTLNSDQLISSLYGTVQKLMTMVEELQSKVSALESN